LQIGVVEIYFAEIFYLSNLGFHSVGLLYYLLALFGGQVLQVFGGDGGGKRSGKLFGWNFHIHKFGESIEICGKFGVGLADFGLRTVLQFLPFLRIVG